jgi:oxygen-dependent protoporphyrinogen oxidase
VEALPVKAMTFSSQKWPGIGEESDVTLVRGSLGRAGDQRDLQRTDAELISIVRAGFAEVTGLRADPVDAHVQRWGGGLPQYRPGHRQRVERIRAVLDPIAGLAVCGASYDGVGIPACIAPARAAADRVLAAMPT